MHKVIICAGEEVTPRWNNYLGVTRHMIPAHGEPLIHRIQRQMLDRGFINITVLCAGHRAKDYLLNSGIHHATPICTKDIRNNFAMWAYRKHISRDGTTVFLYADTYYTDECIDKITQNAGKNFVVCGRAKRSFFGQNCTPELFAVIVNFEWAYRCMRRLEEILPQFKKNVAQKNGACALLAYTLFSTFKAQGIDFWIEHSDLTDDFDTAEEWEIKHRIHPSIFNKP